VVSALIERYELAFTAAKNHSPSTPGARH
jgi:hypothetical protein